MALYGNVGAAPRIIVLVLLILVLTVGGALWFDYLGVLSIKETAAPILRMVGLQPPAKLPEAEASYLLEMERLEKLKESLDLQTEELRRFEDSLKEKEKEINQKLAELEEQRKALQDQEKSFNQRVRSFENKRANLEQNARYLTGMPPAQAVAILLKMEDQDMIDHLRMVEELAKSAGEESIVSFWLSQMPPERAATIKRKMTLR
ncbi:MAG: flagellar protein FlbB [Spirochaetales bacterium]